MITALNHITLAVQEIERSFVFYRDVLGLKPLVKWDRGAYFLIQDSQKIKNNEGFWFCLNVDPKRKPQECYTHYAFSVHEKDFETMAARIKNAGAISFQENSSPGKSFYFLDPDGHKLEIHCGSPDDRVAAKKKDPGAWKNAEWFV